MYFKNKENYMEIRITEGSLKLCDRNLEAALLYEILLMWQSINEKALLQKNNEKNYYHKPTCSNRNHSLFISKDNIYDLSLGTLDIQKTNNALRLLLKKNLIKLSKKPRNNIFSYEITDSTKISKNTSKKTDRQSDEYDIQKAYRQLDKDLRNTVYEEFIIAKKNDAYLKFEDFIKKYI